MITANTYERTYVCVKNSLNATRKLDEVVEFLQSMARPVTCQEIGYKALHQASKQRSLRKLLQQRSPYNLRMNSYSAQLGQMLRHLRQGGFIKVDLIDGAPVEVISYEYVEPQNVPPRKLRVHDDEGNEYTIDNPNWDWSKHRGHFEDVKKTIIPKVKVYYWVGA